MTYQDTLDRIHSFQRFGSRLGLERMSKLMELLDSPQEKMRVIHVGGTNGKGSVCRFLYSALQENGYKIGLYTSPYLERFTERIEYNGSEISEEDLILYTDRVLEKADFMIEEGMESPTEFELITAIAFLYFSEQEIDFLILEVGLGGLGDSTNVVSSPIISVITSISYDHMEYLGDTLEEIALDKAGIIKSGSRVIYNVEDKGASQAIKKIANKVGCDAYDAFSIPFRIVEKTIDYYTFETELEGERFEKLRISMIGMHQIRNAICALAVISVLKKEHIISIEKAKLYAGFSKARQTGRFEILRKKPYMIIDGAHNEAGAASLESTVRELFSGCKILLVIGMLTDKKVDILLERFKEITRDFVATEPDNPRSLAAEDLNNAILKAGMNSIAIKSPEEACRYAEGLTDYDVIVFAGSLYLIGEVRGILNHEKE